jgi:hypothetical protein
MSSRKLSGWDRQRIHKHQMDQRFARDDEALQAERVSLSHALLDNIIGRTNLKKVEELPRGWLPEIEKFCVQIGYGESGDPKKTFNASFGKVDGVATKRRTLDKFNSEHRFLKVFGYDEPLGKRALAFFEQKDKLNEQKTEVGKEINHMLEHVTTTGRLREVWPELGPVIDALFPEAQVPAVDLAPTIKHLNKVLELPKAAA